MTRNVGDIDKIVRILIGVVLIGLAIFGQIGVWGFIGLVPLISGLLGTCPAYRLLGVNTCRRGK
ncbi:DUF2892 domain-containing protein [Cobetia sp. LC6]|uniref:YgaP family membrane protein n=1 Tax=Cobetia sp. LC6 TaxID=3050947 RepID=UPI0025558833|nr:DUF2892 domain-containing protein [Cobetia sp. LC6]MDL2190368.1 DUF2892 domain-containing protein [Cobetia sp. LC6]